jgi:hypothetical protein
LLDVSAAVVNVPDVAFVPVHAPEAVQLVAFVVDHVSLEVPPEATDVGDAENVSVGAVELVTVTVTERVIEPPDPVHVSVYAAVDVGVLVDVPDVAFVPVHAPDAVQLVAFVDDHVSLVVPPDATDVGDAENVSVGAAAYTVKGEVDNSAPMSAIHETSRRRNPASFFIIRAHQYPRRNARHPAVSIPICKPAVGNELFDDPAIAGR